LTQKLADKNQLQMDLLVQMEVLRMETDDKGQKAYLEKKLAKNGLKIQKIYKKVATKEATLEEYKRTIHKKEKLAELQDLLKKKQQKLSTADT